VPAERRGAFLAATALYLLLYGLLWLTQALGGVRFLGVIRTPLDLLVSLPAVALYLTGALMVLALWVEQRLLLGQGRSPPEAARPLARSPLLARLRRIPPVPAQAPPEEALRHARTYGLLFPPCADNGRVVGVVDIARIAAGADTRLPLAPAPVVRVDQTLGEVLRHLQEAPVVVVVDGDTYLGVLDPRDGLRALLG
jgi:hypothetical protein